ncbi:MAG: Hsp20/alpha crystallin family protein [Proteobacteria bacterium]|nr:Hsp20/alpha crystallin family protein [Pseudomonadota bacterium]
MKRKNEEDAMELMKWNPTNELRNFNRLLTHFFEEPFLPSERQEVQERVWAPRVDIYDTKEAFIIKAELPGVEKNDIKIDVDGRVLNLKGTRKVETEENENSYYRREMFVGSFERSFTLPEAVDPGLIKAEYKDGILHLEVPKPEERKPKQILIS